MWQTYNNAKEVFAWIGPEETSTADSFHKLIEGGEGCNLKEDGRCEETRSLPHRLPPELQWMSDRNYWERAWIIQEILQARHLRLVCGSYSCDWRLLYHFMLHFPSPWDYKSRESSRMLLLLETKSALVEAKGLVRQSSAFHVLDIVGTLFCSGKCFEARDHVFAMLGHPTARSLGIQRYIKSNYDVSVDEIFLEVLEWCDFCFSGFDSSLKSKRYFPSLVENITLNFKKALQLSESFESPSSLASWIRGHSQWDLSNFPRTIVTTSGRSINCQGLVMSHLLGAQET
ncbi:hypothetical protein B0I35DRAFT_446656 [Stachybotrys elegans]|uniref:Heterokaryon incompatibility domain-containing protein n=1 Tax=Stachybotrys elegans TaxID=80388 RepID=A0A8K0WJ15_9HYPO|nr:hypothetical protein B0I35DRAFT_446656 [Stachybotrys elegans]